MALLHDATLTPTKRELLAGWLPTRSWFDDEHDRRPAASFRLDDPAGEVGIEGFLLGSASGSTLFVPLTYRGVPLDGAEEHLVGTTEHSVLGTRWVYDGSGDPVFAAVLAATILTGGQQAELEIEVDGAMTVLEPSATVVGSGMPGTAVPLVDAVTCRDVGPTTVITASSLELVVVRVVGSEIQAAHTLTGTFNEQTAVLAGA